MGFGYGFQNSSLGHRNREYMFGRCNLAEEILAASLLEAQTGGFGVNWAHLVRDHHHGFAILEAANDELSFILIVYTAPLVSGYKSKRINWLELSSNSD
jgi:hypothetical protein